MPVYSDKRVLSLFAVAAAFLMLRRISSSFSRSEEEQDLETIPIAKGALPYVGHLLSFNRIPSQLFAEWQKDVGPVFRVRMGVQTWVIVNESRFAHELLTTNGASTSGRPMQQFSYFYYALGGRGIVFAQANKRWKNTRTAALSILAPNMVAKFSHYHKKENQELIERLIKKTEQEGSVHPTKPICMAAMNFILGTCFGRRNESENDPVFKQVVEMMEKGLKVAGVENDISSFLPILSFLDVLSRRGKFFENHIKNLRDPVMKGLVKGALETYQDNLLKRLNDLKETYDLDDDDLLVTASDLIVAGSDTISGTLTWMLAILLHYPDVQQRICDEIDVFIREHKRLPSFTDRDSFPYTIAVQKECMRYRPVVHLAFLHIVEKKVVIGDYVLPKGTAVLPNAFGMNHDPAIFPEPDKFIPERFLNNTKTMMAAANGKIDNRDHFTFGWGRRLCPGIHLAEVQLFDMFTRLFAKCKVEAPLDSNGKPILPDLDNFQDAGVVVIPPPYKARFILRTDSLLDMISN